MGLPRLIMGGKPKAGYSSHASEDFATQNRSRMDETHSTSAWVLQTLFSGFRGALPLAWGGRGLKPAPCKTFALVCRTVWKYFDLAIGGRGILILTLYSVPLVRFAEGGEFTPWIRC